MTTTAVARWRRPRGRYPNKTKQEIQQKPLSQHLEAYEINAISGVVFTVSGTTLDIYLINRACWQNVCASMWSYKLGSYPVLKKWLSHRERAVLDRPLFPAEVHHFVDTARRIAANLLLVTAI